MLITISGPEKAGKSTLCRLFAEQYDATVRHWGPIQDDTEFLAGLQEDVRALQANPERLIVWDRSFVCDYVYSLLLQRDHRFGADPWLAEWLYGRAVQTLGVRAIHLGPPTPIIEARRDDTDLPVNVIDEKRAYREYGEAFGYRIIETDEQDEDEVEEIADGLFSLALQRTRRQAYTSLLYPPAYAGPVQASGVVVVDDKGPLIHGGWLPATSPEAVKAARLLGPTALALGWMSVGTVSHSRLRAADVVYGLGEDVARYLRRFVSSVVLLPLPGERTVLAEVAS